MRVQDALVPGLTKGSVQQGLAQRFGVDADAQLKGRTMAGWYLQQVPVACRPMGAAKVVSAHFGGPPGVS